MMGIWPFLLIIIMSLPESLENILPGKLSSEQWVPDPMSVVNEIQGYEVLATLGHGARSTIYAVRDKKDSQVYALKHVTKQTASDQRFIEQAIQEYEVSTHFNHPALRKSLKLFKQRSMLRVNEVFVLMEMVDGLTFEQERPEDIILLCRLCQQVAKGLAAMHEAGYVHADIKPNNILITGPETVKIIDFGQSCPVGTIKERIQGTPDYIAPEQVKRKTITSLTDVFNLGATIYWLLTAKHIPTMIPKGEPGLTIKTDDQLKSPKEFNAKVPPALSQLVMQCLEMEPSARPGSMGQVHDRLGMSIVQLSRETKAADSAKPNTST